MKKIVSKIYLLLVTSYVLLVTFFSLPALATSHTPATAPTSYFKIFTGWVGAMNSVVFGPTAEPPSLFVIIGRILGVVLSFTGAIFLAIVMYGGVQWMTAGGNEEQVTDARKRVVQAVIGLGISVGAYVIVRTLLRFVFYIVT